MVLDFFHQIKEELFQWRNSVLQWKKELDSTKKIKNYKALRFSQLSKMSAHWKAIKDLEAMNIEILFKDSLIVNFQWVIPTRKSKEIWEN